MRMNMSRRCLGRTRAIGMCNTMLFAVLAVAMQAQSSQAASPAEPERQGVPAAGQQAAVPEFAVATVRPSKADSGSTSGIHTGHGKLDGENVTLKRCIMGAYGVGPNQVSGGPDWVDSERFDIAAKADQPINDDAVLDVMLQGLLADRFKLAFHRESRMVSAFTLEVVKTGAKLEKATGGDSETNTSTNAGGGVMINVRNTDMNLFAQVLSRKMDLPVVNQTGLEGAFNLKLSWTPDNAKVGGHGVEDVSIFDALQQQLGLRLRKTKAPVEMIVIDHVEQPSEN